MIKKIVAIYGDGIGPEIMQAVLTIMRAAKVELAIDVVEAGEKQFKRNYSCGIAPSAWDTIKNNRILLKAPITTPQGKGYKSLNVTLRKTLGLYANVRPVLSYAPYVETHFSDLDLVIIRENEEDLYSGVEYRNTRNSFESLKFITVSGSEKIIRYAFEYALKNKRKKVTCMIKDNIMKLADGAFHKVFNEVAKSYPEIEAEQMIIDIGTAKIANDPERFDVVVTLNLYGDIISDVAAEVSGSIGLAGSANIGDDYAMFEAVHGSAPDIAGLDIANPSGLLNAAIMMLRHLDLHDDANNIANALAQTIQDGVHTADLYVAGKSSKKVGTQDFAQEVIKRLEENKGSKIVSDINQNKSEVREIKRENQNIYNVEHKVLVGVDVFLDNKSKNPKDLAHEIKAITENLKLQLQMISKIGLKIWPSESLDAVLHDGDLLQLRFVANSSDKLVSHNDICALLAILSDSQYDFAKTENLYVYDGELGFTLSQGE